MATMYDALLHQPQGGTDGVNAPDKAPGLGINTAMDAYSAINSPIGMFARNSVPGLNALGAVANVGLNSQMSHALGVNPSLLDHTKAAFGFGPAQAGLDALGLRDADFGTPQGTSPPVDGITTRAHDRFGGPRGESNGPSSSDPSADARGQARGQRGRGHRGGSGPGGSSGGGRGGPGDGRGGPGQGNGGI